METHSIYELLKVTKESNSLEVVDSRALLKEKPAIAFISVDCLLGLSTRSLQMIKHLRLLQVTMAKPEESRINLSTLQSLKILSLDNWLLTPMSHCNNFSYPANLEVI